MAEDQQKMNLKETEMKSADTSVSLGTLMEKKDGVLESYSEVVRSMCQNAGECLRKISLEHERVVLHLREQQRMLEKRRKRLLQRKLQPHYTMNEGAELVTDKVLSWLAEDEKKGSEKLQKKCIELKRKLDVTRAMKQPSRR